jgi:hypothetical protein
MIIRLTECDRHGALRYGEDLTANDIFVNVDNLLTIRRIPDATEISLVSSPIRIYVMEKPQQIVEARH